MENTHSYTRINRCTHVSTVHVRTCTRMHVCTDTRYRYIRVHIGNTYTGAHTYTAKYTHVHSNTHTCIQVHTPRGGCARLSRKGGASRPCRSPISSPEPLDACTPEPVARTSIRNVSSPPDLGASLNPHIRDGGVWLLLSPNLKPTSRQEIWQIIRVGAERAGGTQPPAGSPSPPQPAPGRGLRRPWHLGYNVPAALPVLPALCMATNTARGTIAAAGACTGRHLG